MEWRCAEIISGNGDTYNVQYNCSSLTSEPKVERVPKKAIRPCPPIAKCIDSWSANDVVEVNHAGCWKGAIVSKFLGGDIYLVRLLGSCKALKIHKFNVRARQCWQGDKWLVMQKVSLYLIHFLIFHILGLSIKKIRQVFLLNSIETFKYFKVLEVYLVFKSIKFI